MELMTFLYSVDCPGSAGTTVHKVSHLPVVQGGVLLFAKAPHPGEESREIQKWDEEQ